MNSLRKKGCLFYFLIGLALFLAVYFLVWFPTYSWKQKLTITIETPSGENLWQFGYQCLVHQPTFRFWGCPQLAG